jgi:tRNA A37 threonylcarbamoyladenosine modification protein TsaB
LGKPVIAVCSADAVAQVHGDVTFLGVFAPARQNEYFVTYYERGRRVRATQLVLRDELETHLSKCTLAVAVGVVPGIAGQYRPSAGALALSYFRNGAEKDLKLEPIYLVPPAKVSGH